MKEDMVRERNREIEAIIEKLGDETHLTQKQLMQQYEKKVESLNDRHQQEIVEYQIQIAQMKERNQTESSQKEMLDENIRVIQRRIHDLEIELADKKDKIKQLERTNAETGIQLECIYEEQERMRQDLEAQLRQRIDQKDAENRKLKLDLQ